MPQCVQEQCPDCKGELMGIKLIGRGLKHPFSGAFNDALVKYYAEPTATRGVFTARFDEAGTVRASMCKECKRIFLYGVPK